MVSIDDYLTVFSARNIENFTFKQLVSYICQRVAYGMTNPIAMPSNRIIAKAIHKSSYHKSSKPDLAIAICDDAKKRGKDVLPGLLKQLCHKVVKLAKVANENNDQT